MNIANLKFHSHIELTKGVCPKCKGNLKQNGWGVFDSPLFICLKCENVYQVKLIKMQEKNIDKKVLREFLKKHKTKEKK